MKSASDSQQKSKQLPYSWALFFQGLVSLVCFPLLTCFLWSCQIFFFRFKLGSLKELRRQFKQIIKTKGPVIICANHLTYIDSVIIQYLLASKLTYIFHYYSYAWNLPKASNVNASLFFKTICCIGKCILLPGKKNKQASTAAFEKITRLLQRNQYIMLFPEGTRSRTGKFNSEEFGYGVGQLVLSAPNTRVLCVYMRAESQTTNTVYPKRGDKISMALKLIQPTTELKGVRASRDISNQVVQTIAGMEQEYFASS